MTEPTVKVEGLGQLVRTLTAAGKGVEDLKEANQAASRIVLEEARRRVPRRTGRLEATGRVNKAAKKANVLFGNKRVPYAAVIEYGWPARNIGPHPYVSPAAEATRDQWLPEYEKNVQTLLDDVKGT